MTIFAFENNERHFALTYFCSSPSPQAIELLLVFANLRLLPPLSEVRVKKKKKALGKRN